MLKPILATAAILVSMGTPLKAHADTWGCEVLLCLSNPAGPMAVAQCVPPITRLYRAIFKWRPDPFPTCLMSNGADSSSNGNYAYVAPPSYYDACPEGTSAVSDGTYAAVGRTTTPAEQASMPSWAPRNFIMTSGHIRGIGEGSNYYRQQDFETPSKVCGGTYIGQVSMDSGSGPDERTTITINIYDQVLLMHPAHDTFNINVMMNNRLYRNIRPFSRSNMRKL